MTAAMAWIATRREKNETREHLYIASDSRVSGGHRMDACPKILTLPRSDCALCFAGSTASAYPLMLQIAQAIAAHQPSRERSMDIRKLKDHLLRVCTDLIGRFHGAPQPLADRDVQFLFGGYSWAARDFLIWTFEYRARERAFAAREALSFHRRIRKAAFIGDAGVRLRSAVARDLMRSGNAPAHLEPLRVLATMIKASNANDTVGGAPQVVRITLHMNTRPLCVRWNGEVTLFGRPLFGYENVDYWVVDPFSGKIDLPLSFGRRDVTSAGPGPTAASPRGPESDSETT